jgi:hypothetical protein
LKLHCTLQSTKGFPVLTPSIIFTAIALNFTTDRVVHHLSYNISGGPEASQFSNAPLWDQQRKSQTHARLTNAAVYIDDPNIPLRLFEIPFVPVSCCFEGCI